ncbi:MAG TPA: type IV secretion system protein [Streptosporangiaceae bacterium]
MLRSRRTRRIALVLAALAILLVVPRPGQPAAHQGAGRQPVTAVTVADRSPQAPDGVCSVPGIGDIGSLIGFCAAGQSGLTGDLNNICKPSLPSPEPASAGINSLVKPAAAAGPKNGTLYDNYGMAGDFWAATNLQCSDMTSLIGNNVASMVFDVAKSIDRVIISVYQSAAGEGILSWLTSVIDKLISSLGNAIYFPYLAVVVLLGAMWLAWQGLIRKRATRSIEGTVWMVVACVAAIWLIGRPADFTGVGRTVSDGIGQTLNVAFSRLPSPGQSNCLPVQGHDPQVRPVTYNYASGNGVVDKDANELWTVLVCKPWLDGEFGTTNFAATATASKTPVDTYGRQLLWAQAIAINEKPTAALIQAKQATYSGIANSIQTSNPGIYPLFQGKQWTTRLEIAFAALFAATVAGLLVLLIAVTLILLKLGFLLLLVVGPFFLLIGMHPGFGRVVALRWFEMLVGVLLKQGAVALVLSVLLYAYSLIMGTSDTVLPWALKILMIALVTIAVFIYRRPFQHLFSAVGYGMIGSTERAEVSLGQARTTARENARTAAAAAVPGGFAAYRAARWARRSPAHADGLGGIDTATASGRAMAPDGVTDPDLQDGQLTEEGVPAAAALADGARPSIRGRSARARAIAASSSDAQGRTPPPLNLRSRQAAEQAAAAGQAAGQAGPGNGSRAVPVAAAGPHPSLPAAGLPNGQPRSAGPTSAWPGTSSRQSLGGTRGTPPAAPGSPAPGSPASGSPAPGGRLAGPAASPPAASAPASPATGTPGGWLAGRGGAGARQAPPARQAPGTSPPASSGPASSGPASPAASPRQAPPRQAPPRQPPRARSAPSASTPPASSGPASSGPASSGPASSGPASSGPASSGPGSSGPAQQAGRGGGRGGGGWLSGRPASQPPAARPAAPPPARHAPAPSAPARSAPAPSAPAPSAPAPSAPAPSAPAPSAGPAARAERPGWADGTASRRHAAAAPPSRPAGQAGRGGETDPAGGPLAGHRKRDRDEEPMPFWLKPRWRRK